MLRYASTSAAHAKSMVELIKSRLTADTQSRQSEADANAMAPAAQHVTKVGLGHAFRQEGILSSAREAQQVKVSKAAATVEEKMQAERGELDHSDDVEVETQTCDVWLCGITGI